jgi:AcrR family transcriptional regulator
MARPSNREQVLDAFQDLIVEIGAGNVTLDATAARAGVSKGGLLYHFPSKADLFAALAARLAETIDVVNATAPTEPADLIRWYLTHATDNTDTDNTLWRSLLAATHAVDDDFATVLVDLFLRYSAPLAALDAVLAEHVRLVGDGLYLNALVGTPPPTPGQLEAIIQTLVRTLD